MSKWLNIARSASPELFTGYGAEEISMPRAVSANSAISPLLALTALTARGTAGENTSADNPIVCIFCGEPVERGTPGTGALNGDDLHVQCYRRRYPNGHRS